MRFNVTPRQNYSIDAYGLIENIENQMLINLMQYQNVISQTNSIYIDYSQHRENIHNKIKSMGFNFIESMQENKILISYNEGVDVKCVIMLKTKEKNNINDLVKDSVVGKNVIIKSLSAYYDSSDDIKDKVTKLIDFIIELSTNEKNITVKWVVDNQGRDFEITTSFNQTIKNSLYPFIKEGVDSYVNKFLNSDQSILILIGEPGMGKTSLIRYILAEMNKKAYVTFDESVMANDYIFGEFVNSKSSGAFIIEDADTLLKSRQDNNKLMAKFLNVGDGLISLGQKKLIFTTNLPSTKDIDPALMRRGRCFDVLNFRRLTLDEANDVCSDFNLSKLTSGKEFTLAEIFNRDEPETEEIKPSSFGFI